MFSRRVIAGLIAAGAAFMPPLAAQQQTPPLAPDIPTHFEAPTAGADYVRREVMIPMRDGVKLHTIITVPKGARNAPMLLTRTPYDASARAERNHSSSIVATLALFDELFVADGYIRVYQDVRGKYGSEGEYVMTRPLRGPLNTSAVDHSTDAYDTIDWLVKNTPESNGRVGMVGSSYEGFTVVMALINPHPALKAAVPESPMVDGWMGDDWFHYGAFRQTNLDYFAEQTTVKGRGKEILRPGYDDYENFRRVGSTGDMAKASGIDVLPWWKKLSEHPAYDAFWKEQALDMIMARQPLTVPTIWLQGLWDQEDMWGAIHSYLAVEPKDKANDKNFLIMGPWFHSQINREGTMLGPLKWNGDTTLEVRRDILKPFFDEYLKDGAPKANTPPVLIYNTGENHWDRFTRWPLACADGCATKSTPLYLAPNHSLTFTPPGPDQHAMGNDEYVSDPAKPVPFEPRPVRLNDSDTWRRWLVTDQRFVEDRPDVLVYQTAPLAQPVRVSGAPVAHVVASTSGTDADWVVKVIDVYPDTYPSQPEMGGYELPIAMDIFRGRYRRSFDHPEAIEKDKMLPYAFALPMTNHVFQPGHRIMVQIQSSWFPLYDRNPQTFVSNVMFAKPSDYVKTTQRIQYGDKAGTYIDMPLATDVSAARVR
ncbi:MAG TPA: CocE/NonD family hydrolase [Vicinamibacterales bacterium]